MSAQAQEIEAYSTIKEFKIEAKAFNVRNLTKIEELNAAGINILDEDRKFFRELSVAMNEALQKDAIANNELINFIKLIEIESKLNKRIAENALQEIKELERAAFWESVVNKVTFFAMLALLL